MVETDRARVYCPARCCNRKGGCGRGRQLRRKQFIWSTRNSWGGRPAPLLSKAEWTVRKGCPMQKQPASCLPLSSPGAEPFGQPCPVPVLSVGLPFSVGSPTGRPGGATAEHMATTHRVPGIAQTGLLPGGHGRQSVLHSSEVKTDKS